MVRGRKDTGNGLFFSQEQGKEQIHFYKLERVLFNIKGTRSGRIHFQRNDTTTLCQAIGAAIKLY